MCKKLTLGALGLLLVGGFLFGRNMVPYLSSAANKARTFVKEQIPISSQIDAANQQLTRIDPEIKLMVRQIAKEKVAINRLAQNLEENESSLKKSKRQMLALKEHLLSGDEFYTAADSRVFTNARVEEDLNHRLDLYETAKQTVESQHQVLEARRAAMSAALAKLDEAKALKQELEVRIENLRARNRLNDVAKSASAIDLDNSELARAAEMIDDISVQIDADAEMLQMVPKYLGQIPVDEDSVVGKRSALERINELFGPNDEVVKN